MYGTQATSGGRIRQIDVLRGIVILAVIWFHLGNGMLFFGGPSPFEHWGTGTWSGVELFFVISGFVVSRMLIPQIGVPGALRTFFLGRAFRLLPVALLWIGIASAIIGLSPHSPGPHSVTAEEVVAILCYWENQFIQQHDAALSWYWSLSVEEQFYFFLPPFLVAIRRATHRRIFVIAGILTVIFIIRPKYAQGITSDWPLMRTATALKADSLLSGVLIHLVSGDAWFYRVSTWVRNRSGTFRTSLNGFLLGGLLSVPQIQWLTQRYPLKYFLLNLFAVGLVFTASAQGGTFSPSAFVDRILEHIGKRSYVLYVVHLPIFLATSEIVTMLGSRSRLACLSVALVLVVLATEATHRWVEQPIIRYGRKWLSRPKTAELETPLSQAA